MISKSKLPSGYSIKEVSTEEFQPVWQKHAKKIFNERSLFYTHELVNTDKDRAGFKKLSEDFKSQKP